MALKTTLFDPSEHLETPEDIAEYLAAMFEEGEVRDVALSIGTVARAMGMSELARRTGLSREALYKATSDDGNPKLSTLMAVAKAFGVRFTVTAPRAPDAEAA